MISVFGVEFQNPVLLAAGTAGFGRELEGLIDWQSLGGICSKAVSRLPRPGNPAPRVAEWRGGMINSVGLANPGMEHVVEEELPWLGRHRGKARVIINVVGFELSEYRDVITCLESSSVPDAYELNVSCPNTDRGGEEFGADKGVLKELVASCRDATERPLIVKLSPVLQDPVETANAAVEAGADGFSLVNTFSGLVMRKGRPRLGRGQGGVSGPPLLPLGVLTTRRIHEATGKPVIGLGGVTSFDDMCQYLDAGAALVGVGTAALADPRVPESLVRDWRRACLS